jgi:ataxin-3
MLCGQHALNNLLQSPLFTPQDLADIARQLDAMEASQLDPGMRLKGEGGSWMGGGESQNYDDSGFFSVQGALGCFSSVEVKKRTLMR